MNIVNESAYLYSYSKKLKKINHQLGKLARKAHKHRKKHENLKEEKKKRKHKIKHQKAAGEMKLLLKRHNKILEKLRHHHSNFAHGLRKEHKV